MLELGKPIHTFDAAAVHDGRIVVRLARDGERLETLDHVVRELDHETLLIADPHGPLGIAGVMGGATSEIGDGTTDVVVESAIFDPISIRRTAFRYALRSEASLRFEKGQEHRLARLGADRTARLIAEWAGGRVARGVVDTAPDEPASTRVAFRPSRVERLIGAIIPAAEQRDLLARVGIATERPAGVSPIRVADAPRPLEVDPGDTETLVATVPSWRRDLVIEADITEEVIRVRGYETVPVDPAAHGDAARIARRPCACATPCAGRSPGSASPRPSRSALVAVEAVERFGPDGETIVAGEGIAAGRPVRVTNPLSSQHSVMRQSLLGSLLEVVTTNMRQGRPDVAVFEIGKGYGATDDGDATHEWWRLGFALTGAAEIPAWNRPERPFDLDDAKGVIEPAGRPPRVALAPSTRPCRDDPNLHPGRAARVHAGDALAGRVGELHPLAADALELRGRVIVAELAIAGLSGGQPSVPRTTTPSRHPLVERDLAVVVAEDVTAAAVEPLDPRPRRAAAASARAVRHLPRRAAGRREKSLAFRLAFAADDRTLAEAEVDAAIAARQRGSRAPTSRAGSAPETPAADAAPRPACDRADEPLLPLRGSGRDPDRSSSARRRSGSRDVPRRDQDRRPAALPVLHGLLRARLRAGHDPPGHRHRGRSCSRSCSPRTSPSRSARSSARTGASSTRSTATWSASGRCSSPPRWPSPSSSRGSTRPSHCSRTRASSMRSSAASSACSRPGSSSRPS